MLRCIQALRQDTEKTKRRSFSDKFKATAALEAQRGDKTAQELAAKHKVHPTQMTTWKQQPIDGLTGEFSKQIRWAEDNEAEVKESYPLQRLPFKRLSKLYIRTREVSETMSGLFGYSIGGGGIFRNVSNRKRRPDFTERRFK